MLSTLASALRVFSALLRFWEKFKLKQEVRQEVTNEIQEKEKQIAQAAASVPPVSAPERLRDGKF